MSKVRNSITRFIKDEDGIAVTEYGILLALLAVILIVAVNAFGSKFSTWWNTNVSGVTDKVKSSTTTTG